MVEIETSKQTKATQPFCSNQTRSSNFYKFYNFCIFSKKIYEIFPTQKFKPPNYFSLRFLFFIYSTLICCVFLLQAKLFIVFYQLNDTSCHEKRRFFVIYCFCIYILFILKILDFFQI